MILVDLGKGIILSLLLVTATTPYTVDGDTHRCQIRKNGPNDNNDRDPSTIDIPTSKINDGVCDCCDGSDETLGLKEGGVVCSNTCKSRADSPSREDNNYLELVERYGKLSTRYEDDTKTHQNQYRRISSSSAQRLSILHRTSSILDEEKNKLEEMGRAIEMYMLYEGKRRLSDWPRVNYHR